MGVTRRKTLRQPLERPPRIAALVLGELGADESQHRLGLARSAREFLQIPIECLGAFCELLQDEVIPAECHEHFSGLAVWLRGAGTRSARA